MLCAGAAAPGGGTRAREERTTMIARWVAGLTLVAIGAVFLLGELGVVDEPGALVGAWWPLVVVAVGVGLLVEQRRLGAGPAIFLGAGLLLLTATTDVVALDAAVVWPVVLIAIGAWLLLRPRPGRRQRPSSSRGDVTAVFEDRTLRRPAGPFERAAVTSVFGDVDLDLRDAEPTEGMVVDLTVIFGDVDVTVPGDWRVVMAASGVFADVEHRPPPQPADAGAPLLEVRGFSVFGDVTVRQ